VEALLAFGYQVPRAAATLVHSAAAVLALTAAIRHLVFIWRGPVIVGFRREESTLCDARESDAVRSAAQLRGTMGGAGFVHPRRLVISASAWAAAAAQAIAFVAPGRGGTTFVPIAVAGLAAALAMWFPATPFYYREAAGGCVVVFPIDACSRLLRAAELAPPPTPIDLRESSSAGDETKVEPSAAGVAGEGIARSGRAPP
jgi:hypothetical protein